MNKTNLSSLTVDCLSAGYSNGVIALDKVSFNLQGGTICALVGLNGSGKSTLFNIIMTSIRPKEGKVLINDLSAKKAISRSIVAYVPQSEIIDWDFPISVRDVVMQGRYHFLNWYRKAKSIDNEMVDKNMELLGISNLAKRQIGQLSGGQKKRVFLARALSQQSQILLLDEPFTGVDLETEQKIINILKNLREQSMLILISTHNLGNVPEYCNEVIMLNKTIIAKGEISTTYTQENLAKTFGSQLTHLQINPIK